MSRAVDQTKKYLLSGVSYAIPFVACGGIMIAIAIAFVPMTPAGPDFSNAPFLKLILDIGSAAFSFLVPVLGGYIAFGIADRPGLVAGFVGGYIANQVGAGFLGGLVAGAALYYALFGNAPSARPNFPVWLLAIAGVLVGFGTSLGSGCTSGHGVCGLGRLSVRSLVATAVFLVTGMVTAVVVRHVFGIY